MDLINREWREPGIRREDHQYPHHRSRNRSRSKSRNRSRGRWNFLH